MMNVRTVAGVLSIFSKLIAKLEKIKERQARVQMKEEEKISKANERRADAIVEQEAADKAIAKLSEFI